MTTPNDSFYTYQLRLFKDAGVLASLFIDPQNPDDFIAGYVEAVSQRLVMILSVSPFGRYDGHIAVRTADVSFLMGEDDYSLRLARLLTVRGVRRPTLIEPTDGEDLIHAMCRYAQANDTVITLWAEDDAEHVGRVLQLDDMRVTIGELDYFGQDPRPATFRLRELTMASVGSEDDLLYQALADAPIPLNP